MKIPIFPERSKVYCATSPCHFMATVDLANRSWCWICAGELLGLKLERSIKMAGPVKARTLEIRVSKKIIKTLALRVGKKLRGKG